MSIHSFSADFSASGGFVTIETSNHKSGRMAALKTRLLPILIPARGVNGDMWVADAIDVFHLAGVQLTCPIDGPLVAAPAGEPGCFMGRGLRSHETSSMLRRFIGVEEPEKGFDGPIISSHSLKATTLSWAARYGLSPQTRSMLGRHSSCLNETFAVYSRDLMVGPVSELQMVIDSIANGEFFPDQPRSQFFQSAGPRESEPGLDPGDADGSANLETFDVHETASVKLEPELSKDAASGCDDWGTISVEASPAEEAKRMEVESSDESSSDGSGCLSSDDSDTVEPPARVKRFRAKIPKEEKWYVHQRSHLVHRFDSDSHGDTRFLVCGKRLNESYSLCTEASAWNVLCKSCNRR